MKALFFAVLISVLTFATAYARTEAEIEEMIHATLIQRHPTDTPEWWRGLGENAPPVIIRMYETTEPTYQRVRLIQGLGAFDSELAARFLKEQADHTREDVVRNTAVRAVGASQGAREVEFVSKFLGNEDPQTRYAAAETLKKMNDPRANQVLENYLKREKAPWIAQKLKGQLPKPTKTLSVVGSSEDRLTAEFNGDWIGFFLTPKTGDQPGMNSDSATVKIRLNGGQSLSGEMNLQVDGKKQIWKLDAVTGKGSKISGNFVRRGPEPAPTASPGVLERKEVPFEAELSQQAGNLLLEFSAKQIGGKLIVRKSK